MTQFHYPLPEQEPSSPFSGLSDEARAALSHVAMGPSPANQLLGPDGQALAEIDPSFSNLAAEAHQRTIDLFVDTQSGMDTLVSLYGPELNHVNWKRLQTGYKSYELLGMNPELVVVSEGQPLSTWQRLYSNLRQWQDNNRTSTPHRLKKQSSGDGLFVNEEIANRWNWLALTDNPIWTAVVIPTTLKAPVLNVDHDGNDDSGGQPAELTNILKTLPNVLENDPNKLKHPSVEAYLTLQAIRLHSGRQPVDDEADGLYHYSWLNGTFPISQNSQKFTAAPDGRWTPDGGRVDLAWGKVGDRNGDLGARPEVRG